MVKFVKKRLNVNLTVIKKVVEMNLRNNEYARF